MKCRLVLSVLAAAFCMATSPCIAQYTASLTLTCRDIGFGEGTRTNDTTRVVFTSFDGEPGRPLTQMRTISGRRTAFAGGEFRPNTNSPGEYVADYIVINADTGADLEYGSIAITLPLDDTDGNSVPDILETAYPAELSFTGSITPDFFAGETRFTRPVISGTLSRAAFQPIGSYSMEILNDESGPVAGPFEIQQWSGTIEYHRYPKPMKNWGIVILRENVFGDRVEVRGKAVFDTSADGRILMMNRLVTRPYGFKAMPSVLELRGDRYVGELSMMDGNAATKWKDFADWVVTIVDGMDLDADGIAEISDVLPPIITRQPKAASTHIGGSARFSVKAMGDPPLAYQWQVSGTNIAGATNPTLQLRNVLQSQAGDYRVIVSGPGGSSTSSSVHLLVNPWGHVD